MLQCTFKCLLLLKNKAPQGNRPLTRALFGLTPELLFCAACTTTWPTNLEEPNAPHHKRAQQPIEGCDLARGAPSSTDRSCQANQHLSESGGPCVNGQIMSLDGFDWHRCCSNCPINHYVAKIRAEGPRDCQAHPPAQSK